MSDLNNTEVENVAEDTEAASSLQPAARSVSDPKAIDASKVVMMQNMLHVMGGMNKQDLTDWFEKTMAIYGPNKDHGVGDNSDKNKSSISMKPSHAGNAGPDRKDAMPKIGVREDVEEMFAGEELSEEFKEKTVTLFEAAISARLMVEQARLEEEYEAKLEEEIKQIDEEITRNVDSYLDYVVEQWMEENAVEIESSLRNELMDDFIEGMKNLFSEHYINLPREKVNVVESLAGKVEELEARMSNLISENVELKRDLAESAKIEVFTEMKSGLTLTQQEKFQALAESVDFDVDVESYAKKLKIIKEKYFSTEKSESNIITESFEELADSSSTVHVDPSVNKYVQAISRTVKR